MPRCRRTHRDVRLLWVGFHKRQTGRPSITWPEAVDEALCYGWIDGVRKRLDDERYMIRFSPRQPRSKRLHQPPRASIHLEQLRI